ILLSLGDECLGLFQRSFPICKLFFKLVLFDGEFFCRLLSDLALYFLPQLLSPFFKLLLEFPFIPLHRLPCNALMKWESMLVPWADNCFFRTYYNVGSHRFYF